MGKSALFFLLAFFCAGPLFARSYTSLDGSAEIVIVRKKKTSRFHEAVVIHKNGTAIFETLDDFGNRLIRITFSEKSKPPILKKLLGLPLSPKEFLSYLLYQVPEGVEHLHIQHDKAGRLESVEKRSKRKKENYSVTFLDLAKKGGRFYPQTILMSSHKAELKISWHTVHIE